MSKQTAVEWLEKICNDRGYHLMSEYFEQAKEMEMQQIRTILLAYQEERNGQSDGAQNQWEPYEADEFLENYNQTYGGTQ
jgi:hypothetical protein